jgi:hypothetical protein
MSVIDSASSHRLATALAAGREELFDLLSSWFKDIPGVRTVTYLATAPDKSVTHRVGTSDPEHFPIGGFDPIDDNAWNRRIFVDRLPVVANDPYEMAEFIPETGELVAMGYGALVCAPVVVAGEVRGVVCLLGDAGILTFEAHAAIDTLLPIAALIFTIPGIDKR